MMKVSRNMFFINEDMMIDTVCTYVGEDTSGYEGDNYQDIFGYIKDTQQTLEGSKLEVEGNEDTDNQEDISNDTINSAEILEEIQAEEASNEEADNHEDIFDYTNNTQEILEEEELEETSNEETDNQEDISNDTINSAEILEEVQAEETSNEETDNHEDIFDYTNNTQEALEEEQLEGTSDEKLDNHEDISDDTINTQEVLEEVQAEEAGSDETDNHEDISDDTSNTLELIEEVQVEEANSDEIDEQENIPDDTSNTQEMIEEEIVEAISNDELDNHEYISDDTKNTQEVLEEEPANEKEEVDSNVETIGETDEDDTLDFAASVGGIVWVDANRNGILDKDEKGYPNILVNFYSFPDNKLIYTSITDEDGKYIVENVKAGEYRLVFTNIPSKYSFVAANGYVTDTGVCPRILNFISGENYSACNAPIALISSPINSQSITEYLNVSFVESQIVTVNRSVNLGHRISRNHKICADAAELRVEPRQVYLLNYSANVKFAQEFSNDDYIALQFMINGMYIAEGFSYTKNQGLINGTCLINALNGISKNNESIINFVNLSTKAVRMDNLSITIVKVS